jgi:hypothetical protein
MYGKQGQSAVSQDELMSKLNRRSQLAVNIPPQGNMPQQGNFPPQGRPQPRPQPGQPILLRPNSSTQIPLRQAAPPENEAPPPPPPEDEVPPPPPPEDEAPPPPEEDQGGPTLPARPQPSVNIPHPQVPSRQQPAFGIPLPQPIPGAQKPLNPNPLANSSEIPRPQALPKPNPNPLANSSEIPRPQKATSLMNIPIPPSSNAQPVNPNPQPSLPPAPISKAKSSFDFAIPLPSGATSSQPEKTNPDEMASPTNSRVNRQLVIPLPGSAPMTGGIIVQEAPATGISTTQPPAPAPEKIVMPNPQVKTSYNMEIPLPNKPPGTASNPPGGMNIPPPSNRIDSFGSLPKARPVTVNMGKVPSSQEKVLSPIPTPKAKQIPEAAWFDILTMFEGEWNLDKISCCEPDDLKRAANHLTQLLNVKGIEKRLKGLEPSRTANIFICLAACITRQGGLM